MNEKKNIQDKEHEIKNQRLTTVVRKPLPRMAHGEGTMSYTGDGKIVYKKLIMGKRHAVYGNNPKECIAKMKTKELKVVSEQKLGESKSLILADGIVRWHKAFKQKSLKKTSYDREVHTLNNQILNSCIANMQLQAIEEYAILEFIDQLIEGGYSYSVVKKSYELLNQYFKYYYRKSPTENPMLVVVKPTKNYMNVREKEIAIFDDEDMKLFTQEATRKHKNGTPVYRLGWGLVLLLYSGMRVGEGLAVRWKNVSFDQNIISITESFARVIDEKAVPKEGTKNTYMNHFSLPKTKTSIRKIEMVSWARQALIEILKMQSHKELNDLVFATETGKPQSASNLRRTLNAIQRKANTKVQNSGFHVLRHTFCSRLVREGVDKVVIASIMGHDSIEMIEKVYQHVTEREKIDAYRKLTNFNDFSKIDWKDDWSLDTEE